MPAEPAPGSDTLIRPDWSAPERIRALMSTRQGGAGVPPFDSFSLKLDPRDPAAAENRRRWALALDARPVWLRQVHGAAVAVLTARNAEDAFTADASVTDQPGLACTVMVADCLPVLFCTDDGRAVGAAHAGWRGLAAGVLENTVQALRSLTGCPAGQVQAWLGPCIGPRQFEVGLDVLQAFGADPAMPPTLFVRRDRPDGQPRWLADLPGLARQRLAAAGVTRTSGGRWCTVEEASRFFSFRRDGVGGGGGGAYGSLAAGIALKR
jgi:YfiH family protein